MYVVSGSYVMYVVWINFYIDYTAHCGRLIKTIKHLFVCLFVMIGQCTEWSY